MATDITGGTQAPGSQRIVITSTLDMINGNAFWDSTGVVGAAQNTHTFFLGDVNSATYTNGVSNSSGWGDSTLGKNAPMTYQGIANGAAVGTAQTLYLMSTEGAGADANVYASTGALLLSLNGTLSGAPVGAVPLPAAVWLFGSGLLGLVGVGRRRNPSANA
jgi:hypothetical protein